jgi:RNase P/RNase MRP subunit POP5
MPVLPKKRYLLVEITGATVDEKSVKHLVHDAVQEFLGELGAGKARVTVKAFDSTTQKAVVQCQLDSLNETIAALALKRKHCEKDVKITLKKISGTIKALTG